MDDERQAEGTVLMIDDDPFIAQLFSHVLSKAGYEVIIAKNGTDGLEIARAKKPDAILLDVMMPGPDGFEVLDELKEGAATKDIPVIMLTSLNQPEDVARGKKGGAFAFLVKARTVPEDTINAIAAAIESRRRMSR